MWEALAVMGLLMSFAAVTCATFLLFLVNARYRMPVYPVMALAGGWGIVEAARRSRKLPFTPRAALALIFLAAYAVARVDWAGFTPNVSRWHDERRRAWVAAGARDAGIADLRQWLARHPEDAAGHYNLGILLFEAGQSEAAEEAFMAAVRLDPAFSPAWYNLGLARLERGDASGAVVALERRVAASPEDAEAWHALARARRLRGDAAGFRQHLVAQQHPVLAVDRHEELGPHHVEHHL